jgi:hypothetical protein
MEPTLTSMYLCGERRFPDVDLRSCDRSLDSGALYIIFTLSETYCNLSD